MIPAHAPPVRRDPLRVILLTVACLLGPLESITPIGQSPGVARAAEPSAASRAVRARKAGGGRSSLAQALAADPNADSSYTRLAHPEVAQRMELTDEQRAQVTELMAQRAGELAAAAESDWPAVIQKHEDLLKAILTEAQQLAWSDRSVQRSLRFNFAAQRWEHVLGWFAEQAGLSLIMNAPPPGTFTYNDAKAHTPTEAIELLNSVLVTRGFTLVRRDQMLLLIDITAPIPAGVLPRITPEELKDRGKFEMVTVLFDVGRRDVELVEAEIKQLLGPHGKSQVLPASRGLLVTDTVEVCRAIAQVIENIPEPPAPPSPATPPVKPEKQPPDPPRIAIYPIGLVDREAMLETLQLLVPSAKFVIDPATSRLNAYATPNQHLAITAVLKEMEAEIPPEDQRTLEIYPLDNLDLAPPSGESSAVSGRSSRRAAAAPDAPPPTTGDRFLSTLQAITPGAQFTLDTVAGRLIAWATIPEHALIRSVLEKMASGPLTETRPRLEVYPLANPDPTETLATFQTLMPDAVFSFDVPSSSMLAIATAEEHVAIQAALDKLQPDQDGLAPPEVRFYPLTRDPPATLVTTLQALIPRGSIEVDVENKRLMVVATPSEHEKVRTAVDELEASAPEKEERTLTVYGVTPAQRTRFEAIMTTLTAEFPEVKIITDAEPGELSVWATAIEHAAIGSVLDELKKGVPSEAEFKLRFHPIRSVDPTELLAMLAELYPNTRIVHQPASRRLMVWTQAAEQEAIAESLVEIEGRVPGADAPRFETYTVRGTASPTFLATLQAVAPGATLTVDAASGKLIVWARADEQAVIETAIEKLQYGDTPENTPVLKIYRLTRAEPQTALSLLTTVAPEATLSLDANTGGLIAMAVPADHETIAAVLEQLQPSRPGPDSRQLRFHPLQSELPANVLAIVENLVPSAQITVDADAKRLMVLATSADHETITATLDQVEQAAPPEAELRFYPLERELPASVLTVLQSLAPKAQITHDVEGAQLMVLAPPADHALIAKTLEDALATLSVEQKAKLAIYSVTSEQRTRLEAVLATMTAELPSVRVIADTTPGQLSVMAKPSEHALIAEILSELAAGVPPERELKLTVYPIKSADPANVLTMLQDLHPDARIIHDAKTDRLLVWARQEEQVAIRAMLEEIDVERSSEDQPRFAAYPVRVAVGLSAATQAARSAAFLADLQTLVPEARLTIDSSSGTLIAFASPTEQAIIKVAVENLDRGGSPSNDRPELEIHTLGKNLDPTMTLTLLAGLVPRAELTLDTPARRIIALAYPEDHEAIRATLAKLQSDGDDPNKPDLRFYTLNQPAPATLIAGLQQLVPDAQLTLDLQATTLMAVATPSEHTILNENVQRIAASLADERGSLVIYPVAAEAAKQAKAVLATIAVEMPGVRVVDDESQGNQLSVWATPAEHVAIGQILEQVSLSVESGEKTQLGVYPIKSADPQAVLTMLQGLLANVQFVVDAQGKRLMALADSATHEMIRSAVEQIESDAALVDPPGFESFTLKAVKNLDPSSQLLRANALVVSLQSLVPDARLALDPESGTLIAWGTPQDLDMLRAAVEKLGLSDSEENPAELRFYPLAEPAPTDFVTGLQALAPEARFMLDTAGRNLMAVADTADHVAIRAAVEQIDEASAMRDRPRFEVYAIQGTRALDSAARLARTTAFLTNLQPLAPNARLTVDGATGKLVAWATSAEQEIIRAAIGVLGEEDSPENTPQMEVYPLTKADPTTILGFLQSMFPDAQLAVDPTQGSLVALAVPVDQEAIAKLLERLQAEEVGANKLELRYYPVQQPLPAGVLTVLGSLAPRAQLSMDADGKRVMVVATPSDHQIVQATIEQVEKTADGAVELRFYPLERELPASLLAALAALAPKAQVTPDLAAKRLLVVANPSDQEIVKKTIEEAATSLGPVEEGKLAVYPVTLDQRTRLQAVLTNLAAELPGVQVIADSKQGEIAIWAKPSEHLVIADILEQITSGVGSESAYRLAMYPIGPADPTALLAMLTELYPTTRIIFDAKTGRLMVWTNAAEQASIKATLAELSAAIPTDIHPRFDVFTLHGFVGTDAARRAARAATLTSSLQILAPKARLTLDPSTGRLIAWGTPKELAMVRTAVEKLSSGSAAELEDDRPTMEIHPITAADPTTIMTLLAGFVPDAQIVIDPESGNLVAVAREADQEVIRSTLSKLQSTEPGDNRPELRFYPLSEPPPASLVAGLQGLTPKAQVTVDAGGKHLMVLGTPAEHVSIKQAVAQLEDAASLKDKPYFESYDLAGGTNLSTAVRTARNTTIATNLQTLVPDAQIVLSAGANGLIAFATASQHEDIQTAVAKLAGGDSPETTPVVVVYPLTKADPATTLVLLQTLLPETVLSVDAKTESLVALAVPADQKVIADTLQQLQGTESGRDALELRFYPLTEAPPAGLVEGLTELAPKARITLAADGKNLMVIASAADHEIIGANVDKVEAAAALRERPRFDTYVLPGLRNAPTQTRYDAGRAFLTTLQPLVPGANLTVDFNSGKLIAWGTSEEHEIIRQAVGQIGQEDPEDVPVLESYPLRRSDPAGTLAMLQTLVPNARLAIDARTSAVIALAVPADQKVIADAIRRLEPGGADASEPDLRVYPLKETISPTVVAGLQSLAPRAKITLDTDGKSLTVIATESDHTVIQTSLSEMESAAASREKNQLIIYPVTAAQRTRLEQIVTSLTAELPGIQVITDAQPGSVSIWAKPSQHIVLVGIMQQLTREVSPEEKYRLVGYPLGQADPDSVLSVLQELFPETSFTLDKRGRRLMVYARASEHEDIAAALLEMNAVGSGVGVIDTFMVYPLPGVDTTTALQILTELVPDARLFGDVANETISAYGRSSDHLIISQTLQQFQAGPGGLFKPYLMIYPTGDTDLDIFSQLLDTLVPNAKVVVNTEGRSLAVFAKQADHELVTEAINSMSISSLGAGKPTFETYTLEEMTTTTAISILQQAVPQAQLSAGSGEHQLIANARPSDHEIIKGTLEKIDVEAADDEKTPNIYILDSTDTRRTYFIGRFLQESVPEATFTPGMDASQLITWATAEDHETIATLLEQFKKEPPEDMKQTFETYILEEMTTTTAIGILQQAVPQAQLSAGSGDHQLIANARPSDHEIIKGTLEKIDVEAPDDERIPNIYIIDSTDTRRTYYIGRFLQESVPEATFTPGMDASQLITWATAEDHETIATLLEQFEKEPPEDKKQTFETYILDEMTTTTAIGILQQAVPQAQLSAGSGDHQLVANARPSDHEIIKGTLEKIDVEAPDDEKTPNIYIIDSTDTRNTFYISMFLQRTVQDATFTPGMDPSQLIAWATAEDHETIVTLLEQFEKEPPADKKLTFETYILEEMTTTTAIGILQQAVPQAQLSAGSGEHQLVANARPSDHEIIKGTLEKIDVEAPDDERTPGIYIIDSTSSRSTYYIGRFLQQSVPDATFTPGMDPSQLIAWATAEDHETIVLLLEQFEKDPPADKVPSMEIYTLESGDALAAIAILTPIVPGAELSVGSDAGQLTAWARAEDHVKIVEALGKMEEAGLSENAPTMVVYPLESGDVLSAITVLTPIVPEAQLTPGGDATHLVAWARPSDHEKIKQAVATLVEAGPPPEAKSYTLQSTDALTAIGLLAQVVPDALANPGADPYQMVVWARPADHEKIEKLIAEFDVEGSAADAPTFVTYTLKKMTAATAMQIVALAVPRAELTAGEDDYRFIARARPSDHELIAKTLEQTDVVGLDEATVAVYTLSSSSIGRNVYTIRFLTTAVPNATFTLGSDPSLLIARATPKDHEDIARLLEQLDQEPSDDKAKAMQTYTLKTLDATAATAMLTTVAPEAVCTTGSDPYQLLVFATPKDHMKVAAAILEADKPLSPEEEPTFETYGVKEITAVAAMGMLELVVPRAELSAGGDVYQFVAHARPEDQEKIVAILKQIDVPGSEEHESKPVAYTLESGNAQTSAFTLSFLQQAFPTAQFASGADPTQIVAWAGPKDHEDIAILIEQLDQEPSDEKAKAMQTYTLKTLDATAATAMLTTVAPEAVCTTGSDPYQLLVFATPKDHVKVAAAILEADKPLSPEEEPTFETYGVKEITAVAAMGMLELVVPRAKLSAGGDLYQFVAHARPEDQEKIVAILKQIDVPGSEEHESKPIVYTLESGNAQTSAFTLSFLQQAFPTAQFASGADPTQIVAWAGPKDHEDIAVLIEQLDQEPSDEKAKAMQTYTLKTLDATAATAMLANVAPDAVCTTGSDPYQLLVFATPKDHMKVAAAILEADKPMAPEEEPTFVTYSLDETTVTRAIEMLQEVAPRAEFTAGETAGQMIVRARPEDHLRIAAAIDQIDVKGPDDATVAVYTLGSGSFGRNIYTLRFLNTAVPNATFTFGTDPSQLIARASPKDHQDIVTLLAQLDQPPSGNNAPTVMTYRLESTTATAAIAVLTQIVPSAVCTAGVDAQQLIVLATPYDHTKVEAAIAEMSKKGPPGTEPTMNIYTLENTSAAGALAALQRAVPQAELLVGTDPRQIIAWATRADHEILDEAVKSLSEPESELTAPRMVVYPLETIDSRTAITFLQTIVPDVQFGAGANPRQLIAWARRSEHDKIKAAIEELSKEEPIETAPRVEVYTIESTDAATAISVLEESVPEASFTLGSDPRKLIAFARPSEHEKIAAAIEQLEKEEAEAVKPSLMVYDLESSGAAAAMGALQEALPEVQFIVGDDPNKLIVWAYPEDHAIVEAAVEEIEADGWLAGNRVMSVYPMKREDAQTLMSLLDPVLQEHAQFVTDDARQSLIVWADAKHHDAIKKTIDQYVAELPEAVEPVSKVYRFRQADPVAAYRVLSALVPQAEIAPDSVNRSLVILALPEDHEKIQATIDEMDVQDAVGAPVLKIHRLTTANPTTLLSVLTDLFRLRAEVQLSLDENNDTLIAVATPAQHAKIVELIGQIEEGALLDSAARLQLFPLKDIDSYSAMEILTDLFDKQGAKVDLSIDRNANQLVVIGRPEQHETITGVLDQLRAEERQMEILQLDFVDSDTAVTAISNLFADEGYYTQPMADFDPYTGNLFIRGTQQQLADIRQLLIKMGETSLAPTQGSQGGRLRVVPFQGDVDELVEKLRAIWPDLAPGDVQVIAPESAPPEPVSPEPEPESTPEPSAEPTQESTPEPAKGPTTASPSATPPLGSTSSSTPTQAPAAAQAPDGAESREAESLAEAGHVEADGPAEDTAEDTAEDIAEDIAAPERRAPRSPILIMPGPGTLTIASEDTEALDALESLLLSSSRGPVSSNRTYSIFQLENTSATAVATQLREMFQIGTRTSDDSRASRTLLSRPRGLRRSSTPLLIVPDERLNTILVHGSRADRSTVEELLKDMDTSAASPALAARQPTLIPIEHTDAEHIEQIIRSAFRSQFGSSTSGGSSNGFTPQLTVDEMTNSLVVIAPPPLLEAVQKLAETLDTAAADDPSSQLKIYVLQKTNSARVEEILNAILRSSSGRRR